MLTSALPQTYISGDSLVILRGPHDLLQTISHGEETILSGVAADARSGKLATTDGQNVYVYQPIGREYGDLRVRKHTHPLETSVAHRPPVDVADDIPP